MHTQEGERSSGLGVAHPGVVEGFHGAEFERPLPRMAEYIQLVRRYLRGDPEGFEGSSSLHRGRHFGKRSNQNASIPIYNGALGPGNVRLTGQYADGWVPNLYPDSRFEEAQSWLADGAARGDRDPESIDVAMYVLTAVDEDPERARRAAAEHVAYYLRDIRGVLRPRRRGGRVQDVVEAVREAPRPLPVRSGSPTGSSITLLSSGLPRMRGHNSITSGISVLTSRSSAPRWERQRMGRADVGGVRAVAMR